jgi:hypothetical protein
MSAVEMLGQFLVASDRRVCPFSPATQAGDDCRVIVGGIDAQIRQQTGRKRSKVAFRRMAYRKGLTSGGLRFAYPCKSPACAGMTVW